MKTLTKVVRPECIASGQEELLKFTGFKSIGQKRKEIRRIVVVQQGSSHTEQKKWKDEIWALGTPHSAGSLQHWVCTCSRRLGAI